MYAKERTGGGARLGGGRPRQRGDQDTAGFGLPPGIDDRACAFADMGVVPVPGFRVDRLTDRSQNAQTGQVIFFDKTGAFAHQRANRGRGGVEDADFVLFADLPETPDIRVARNPFEHQGGCAIGQRAVHDIGMAGHPADIGGAPIHLAIPVIEHILVSHRRIDQITAGGMQHPFRVTGRTGGIENEQRVFRIHFFRRAVGIGPGTDLVIPNVAGIVEGSVAAGMSDHDDFLNAPDFRVGQGFVNVLLQRHGAPAAFALIGGDHHFRPAAFDPRGQRIRGKAAEDDGMHRPDPGAGEHGNSGFRDHRHIQAHTIPFPQTQCLHGIGEAADARMQFFIGDVPRDIRAVAFKDDGGLIAPGFQMAVQAIGGDVQRAVFKPSDGQVVGVVRGVFDLAVRFDPVETFTVFAPKRIRILYGGGIHVPVCRVVTMGPGGDMIRNRTDSLWHVKLLPCATNLFISAPETGQADLRRYNTFVFRGFMSKGAKPAPWHPPDATSPSRA